MSKPRSGTKLSRRTLGRIVVDDEAAMKRVPHYAALKDVLQRDDYRFQVLPSAGGQGWDRALLLNLTYWHAAEGGDVLSSGRVPADVVAHAAWHHLAARALFPRRDPSAAALFLGESIASAFDAYAVGHLLQHAPHSAFLATQVPAMRDAALGAGMTAREFVALLARTAANPERAFGELRALLFDATTALYEAKTTSEAHAALARLDRRPFAPLLHHYELSNWVLYARAYATTAKANPRTFTIDAKLRTEARPVEWLAARWLA